MNRKKQAPQRPQSGIKSSDIGYVVKYFAEGPERERFYQYGQLGGRETIFSDLSGATLFRSLESAMKTAYELDTFDPAGRGSHVVVRLRHNVPTEVVTDEDFVKMKFGDLWRASRTE